MKCNSRFPNHFIIHNALKRIYYDQPECACQLVSYKQEKSLQICRMPVKHIDFSS